MRPVDVALELHGLGASVIRLGSPSALNPFDLKIPSVDSWSRYVLREKRASRAQITEWWRDMPDANVGFITGEASGIVIVDADNELSEEFVRKHLTHTPWRVKTGVGRHFYYRWNRRVHRMRGVKADIRVDLIGDGSLAVAHGSVHHSGRVYFWDRDPGTDGWNFADLPVLSEADLLCIEILGR